MDIVIKSVTHVCVDHALFSDKQVPEYYFSSNMPKFYG